MERMSATVRELNQQFIDLWWECHMSDACLPDLGPCYTERVQAQNEKQLGEFLDQVDRIRSNPPRSREELEIARLQLGVEFRRLAEEALGFSAAQLDLLPSQAFSEAAGEFLRKARAFDPGLSGADLYQAGRNAWTANGLQWLLGLPVKITSSLLAYSLLYPYTDNYLDDPKIAAVTKIAFNERLRRRLEGERAVPVNLQERVIFNLVAMIEKEYPRSDHPRVFESLLAIHRAQGRSLDLLRGSDGRGDADVLSLSFEKGGTSVLADGYLVSGSLSDAQRDYTYGHGVFAQLLDDMEDVEQDSRAGQLTLYSKLAGHEPLDALANRTFHFGRKILLRLDCFEVGEPVRQLIRRGADLILIDAIGRTRSYYTPSYLCELEAHSPFRFSFLDQQRNALFQRHGSLGKLTESVMLFSGK